MHKKAYAAAILLLLACLLTFGICVAKFGIRRSSEANRLSPACFSVYTAPKQAHPYAVGSEYRYDFTVSNYKEGEGVVSEVPMRYDVVVAMPEGFSPLQELQLVLDCDGEDKYPVLSDEDGKIKYVFANAGAFSPLRRQTHDCSLRFLVEEGYDRIIDIKGIRVSVVCAQREEELG